MDRLAVPSTRSARRASTSTRSKGLYDCHGCGKGGDLFTFVQETQGLDFTEAVEWLAERFRIPIEYDESGPRGGRATATAQTPV